MARARDQYAERARAVDALYRRYSDWLRRKIKRRFGPAIGDTAEDIVQEAYLRFAAYEPATGVRHPRALLLRVANNLALNQLRRTERTIDRSVCIEDVAKNEEHGVAAVQDEAVLLRQIVSALPPPLREVSVLSRFAGMTNREIASTCGLSIKTVEGRMTKALSMVTLQLRD